MAFATVGQTAVVSVFDGDALFGFWALIVELPRRIGAPARGRTDTLAEESELGADLLRRSCSR